MPGHGGAIILYKYTVLQCFIMSKKEPTACYSVRVYTDCRRFVREYGAIRQLEDFKRFVMEHFKNPKPVTFPKAMAAPPLESTETRKRAIS